MVMIRCPSCGQRTLDVASKCPKCGHVLLQNPLETHAGSELVSCRRCGKHISRHASVCQFCGHHVGRARRALVAASVGAAALMAAAVGWGAYRAGYLDWLIPSSEPAAVALTPAVPAEPDTAPPNAAPILVPPPDSAAAQPAPGQPAEGPPAPDASLRTRWTTEWANVRQDRSISSAVVRVLAPGVQISVGRLRDGWWEYYEDGTVRGYIANSVLAAQRG